MVLSRVVLLAKIFQGVVIVVICQRTTDFISLCLILYKHLNIYNVEIIKGMQSMPGRFRGFAFDKVLPPRR